MEEVRGLIDEITQGIIRLNQINDSLQREQSRVDQEVSDLYHYIEFNDLDACSGYKAYKDLQRCLKRRRSVKNDLSMIAKTKLYGINEKNANNIKNNILADVKEKKYTPRVRRDLFE